MGSVIERFTLVCVLGLLLIGGIKYYSLLPVKGILQIRSNLFYWTSILLGGIASTMSKGTVISNVVKRSVSFSPTVNAWAEEMVQSRGQENNFSAFLADLVREAREREAGEESANSSASQAARNKIVKTVKNAGKNSPGAK